MAPGGGDWLPTACALAGIAAGSFALGRLSAQRGVAAADASADPAAGSSQPAAAAASGARGSAAPAAVGAAAADTDEASLQELLSFFAQLPPKPLAPRGKETEEVHSTAKVVLLCASGKGGVGKSTVSVNFAYTLHRLGLEVGLLDLDVYGPSLPELVALPEVQVMQNTAGRIVPLDYGGVALMSWGYVQPGEAATIRAPILSQIVGALLTGVEWGNLDVLVIDSPPGTGDILLSLSQTLTIDGAVLVTTCNNISFADVRKGLQLFEKVEIPPMLVVANMADFSCDRCGCKHELFADGARDRLPKLLEAQGVGLVRLPLDPELSKSPEQPLPSLAHAYPFVRNPDNERRPVYTAFESLAVAALRRLLGPGAGRAGAGRVGLKLRAGGSLEVRLRGGELRPLAPCELRAACRCALCVDEITGESRIDQAAIKADTTLRATAVEPRGNYAVTVTFSDGHSSLVALRPLEQIVGAGRPGPIDKSGGW